MILYPRPISTLFVLMFLYFYFMHLIAVLKYVVDFWFLLYFVCMWDMYDIITSCTVLLILRVEMVSNVMLLVQIFIGACILNASYMSYMTWFYQAKFSIHYFDHV